MREREREYRRAGCAAINSEEILAGTPATAFHGCHWAKKICTYKRQKESEEKRNVVGWLVMTCYENGPGCKSSTFMNTVIHDLRICSKFFQE